MPWPWRIARIRDILYKHGILSDSTKRSGRRGTSEGALEEYENMLAEMSYRTGTPLLTLKQGFDDRQLRRLVEAKRRVELSERLQRVADYHSKPDKHFKSLQRQLRQIDSKISRQGNLLRDGLRDLSRLSKPEREAVERHKAEHSRKSKRYASVGIFG